MTTLGTMSARILDDLDRNDLTAQAKAEIKTAIAYYENESFWFLEQRSTSATVAGQEFYGLPGNFRRETSLVINVNNWTYPLHQRQYVALEDWFVKASTFTGYPTDFAIYDEQIRLYPIPNGAYTMTLSYQKQSDTLSADGDTNEWMTDGEELIRARAEFTLFARMLRDFDAAQAVKITEQETLRQHKQLNMARVLTGHSKKRTM